MPESDTKQHCGYVAIVGRPNVGKSTLLNHLMGQKLSITSRRPQTTRHNFLGIKTEGNYQYIYMDTPGIHVGQEKAINRFMNRSASNAIRDVDVIIFVLDRCLWTPADQYVADQLRLSKAPLVIVLNKVDKIEDKSLLIPHIEKLSEKFPAAEIISISALYTKNLSQLENVIQKYIPEGSHFYPQEQITDRSQRFLAAELVREKITRQLGAELPYQATVEIEEFRQEKNVCHISALILVERAGQKKIIIGDKGGRLKQIGMQARLDMERLFDCKVMLKLWVKVRSGWSDDERALRSLGYRE